jgi:hypothetical protein
MIYTIASLLVLVLLWLLCQAQDQTLDMERRFWIDSRRLAQSAVRDSGQPH